MTNRQLYNYLLTELNKVKAPSLLLEDYNYFINKGIGQVVNKMYNLYEINQQKSDDLRVLKSTSILIPTLTNEYSAAALLDKTYQVNLPDDYLHILNCVLEYTLSRDYKCYDQYQKIHMPAKRMTSDIFPQSLTNYYVKPKYNNPYFYINNIALDTHYPINETPTSVPSTGTILSSVTITFGIPGACEISVFKDGVDYRFVYSASSEGPFLFSTINSLQDNLTAIGITSVINNGAVQDGIPEPDTLVLTNPYIEGVTNVNLITGLYLTISLTNGTDNSFVNRVSGYRYGNKSKARMEIRYGNDNSIFVLSKVYVDYLRSPQFIQLTQTQIDEVADTSQILEFPDYICQEIVNETIKLLMENASDPRLQTNIPVNQSIAVPGQGR